MYARFSAFPSGPDRILSPVEDLDVNVTQTFGGKESVAHVANRSRVQPAGTASSATARGLRVEAPREMPGYELFGQLGSGGMGVVYEARHRATGEHVALKTIDPRSPGAEESLRREIWALRQLDHPGVVRLLGDGSCRGVPFYAMDLLSGPSLATVFAHEIRNEARPSQGRLTILRRIASALAFVHAQGIVHRDLNPSNIVFRAPDQPVLVDFGLAAHFPAAAPRESLEGGGTIVGTLAYMAPEQIRGQLVDGRADLYAFGCILYQALTGRVPFTGNRRDTVLRQHLEAVPCPPSVLSRRVPTALEQLSLRLLAKTPAERTGSAAEIAALLGSLGATDWDDAPPAAHEDVHRR